MNISTLAAKKLESLTEEEKVVHYNEVCEALGLDPRKRPFEYLHVDNEYEGRNLILYVTKAGSNQLRDINGIDVAPVTVAVQADVAIATANAKDRKGRTDSCIGAVALTGLKGKDLANAIMSAETKAKRRVTISISGVGFLDETEVQDLSGTITKIVPDAALAPQLAAPVTAAAAESTEVTPFVSAPPPSPFEVSDRKPTTEELTEFRKRYEKLALDLQMSGVIASVGQTAPKRIRTWFLKRAGVDGKDLTFNKWRETLGFMEQSVTAVGIKGLADRILKETE